MLQELPFGHLMADSVESLTEVKVDNILYSPLFYQATDFIIEGDFDGFGWEGVNFLHRHSYGAMFWISEDNTVDNTFMFRLLLSSSYTVSRPSLFLTLPCQRVGWGCTRSWEGVTARTANPNW